VNGLDIFIIVAVAVASFLGWRRGIIGPALTVVGLILGVLIAGQTYFEISAFLEPIINKKTWADVISFALIVIGTIVATGLVSKLFKKLLKSLMLGWIDNAAGMILGILVASLGITTFLSIVGLMPIGVFDELLSGSNLAPFFEDTLLLWMLAFLPSEFDRVKDLIN